MSAMDEAREILDVSRPFLRRDALRAGMARSEVDGARFRSCGHGLLVSAAVPDSPVLRAQAALASLPPAAFASHDSAARVWEAPIATSPDEHVTVVRREDRRRRRGRVCHVDDGPGVVVRNGVRVSSLPRLFTEMTDRLPLVELVVLGDWMVRRRGVSPEALRAACLDLRGELGRRAREAAAYVRPRVDSPMETRVRMLLVLAGLPEPEVNHEIRATDGELLRRYDLCWPLAMVIVEYNGRVHVATDAQWGKDLRRREDSDDEGWRMLVLVARDIYVTPGDTVDRVWRTLRSRKLPGLPARPSDAWRPHFPGRSD